MTGVKPGPPARDARRGLAAMSAASKPIMPSKPAGKPIENMVIRYGRTHGSARGAAHAVAPATHLAKC